MKLKEEMGSENLLKREEELLQIIFDRLPKIPGIEVLEVNNKNRLGVISFILKSAHFNLVVKLLNDRFGIQTRGGCTCAGTYGHMLLHVDELHSYEILDELHQGHLACKPGWVRLSVHPIMTNDEVSQILTAIEQVALNYNHWKDDYEYDAGSNEYRHKHFQDSAPEMVSQWFSKKLT